MAPTNTVSIPTAGRGPDCSVDVAEVFSTSDSVVVSAVK